MPDIFLSYNREDQATARRFAEGFEAAGFAVWWDVTLKSGEAYDEVTETALKTAKAVVVLWSKKSVLSRWVRAEATVADRNKTLIPVMIEPCERPIMFELTQTADLGHWQGAADDGVWQALIADVHRYVQRAPAPTSPDPAPTPDAPPRAKAGKRGGASSLAILPFTNRSGLAEDDVFAFGMVEDIIDAMSRGVGARVIASSATARFRHGAIPDLAAMAEQLGVRHVLEGNVRRSGRDLRVTTQLIDAASGNIVWTGKFDRPLDQLANLQEDLVLEVASHLRAQTSKLEIERALRKVGDLTAWEALMRGVSAFRKMTGPSVLMAIEEAKKAVDIAPEYGLAQAFLFSIQTVVYHQFMPDNPAEVQRLRAMADKAMALDPDNSMVMSTVAGPLAILGFPEDALAAALRAISLNPNNEFGYFGCGSACALLNRPDDAVAYFDKEMQIAPDHPTMWISYGWRALAHILAGRWAEAEDAYGKAILLTPDNAAPHIGRAVCRRQLGRPEDARASMGQGRKCEPDTPLFLWEFRYGRVIVEVAMRDIFLNHMRALWTETEPG